MLSLPKFTSLLTLIVRVIMSSKLANSLLLVGLVGSLNAYAGCIPIQGMVRTQSVNAQEQVGKIRISSDSPVFKSLFGQDEIEGGVHGTIDSQTTVITLHHEIGFSGVGSFTTTGDQAIITGAPDSLGNYPVTESVKVNQMNSPYNGAFYGLTLQKVVAKGVVNFTTGTNVFKLTGSLCQ